MDQDYDFGQIVGQIQNELNTMMKSAFGTFFGDGSETDYFENPSDGLFQPGDIQIITWNGYGDEGPSWGPQEHIMTHGLTPEDERKLRQALENSKQDALFFENYDMEDDSEVANCFFYAPFGIYVMLSVLLLILTIFLAVMCHRRRRLLYLHQRSMDNREEFRAEFFEPSEQNQFVKTGILDKPPSYEKVRQEDDMLPKYEELEKGNIV